MGGWPFCVRRSLVAKPQIWGLAELPGLGFLGLAIRYRGTGTGPARMGDPPFPFGVRGVAQPRNWPRLNCRG